MTLPTLPISRWTLALAMPLGIGVCLLLTSGTGTAQKPLPKADEFETTIRPILAKYCLDCHSTKAKKGSLDLERFATLTDIRHELKPWQQLIEQIEAGEMPPKDKPQLNATERKQLLNWTHNMLETEAKARVGDPGRVPLRRLSNAEYDYTIRDLTGIDLRPTREFPADGAAGEGFTNAAEALTDISPTLLTKYLNAAKDIAEHAIPMQDGIRFSPTKTRRDWTIEATERLRQFYARYANGDGRLSVAPYLRAAVKHRETLIAKKITLDTVATQERLNAKYFNAIWQMLNDTSSSQPLDTIRKLWISATDQDVNAIVTEIERLQNALWKTNKIGSYVQQIGAGYAESLTRQVEVDPPAQSMIPIRLPLKASPGQQTVRLQLSSQDLGKQAGNVIWQRPRFEAPGKPALLLKDYSVYGFQYETDISTAFRNTSQYLAAVIEVVNSKTTSHEEIAKKYQLDAAYLKRWVELVGIEPLHGDATAKTIPAVTLTPLEEHTPKNDQWPAIAGWKKKGTDLPAVIANSSDAALQIPGRVVAHGVSMHPLPQEFVAVSWKSPVTGEVSLTAKIAHAHPACGNGVAWWIEHRHNGRATPIGDGNLELGKEIQTAPRTLKVEKGDEIVLAVDAKNGDHSCDMTEIAFTIKEQEKPARNWSLTSDVANSILIGNPHADQHGNKQVWMFARGMTKDRKTATSIIPTASILGQWRTAASDPKRQNDATTLAKQAETILSGPLPKENDPNRSLFDKLVSMEGQLLSGLDLSRITVINKELKYGIARDRFDAEGNIHTKGTSTVEIQLPVALITGRELVVEAKLDGMADEHVVRVRASMDTNAPWQGAGLANANGKGYQQLLNGNREFRKVFPLYTCFPHAVPTDEVVSLKMFHREDEPLIRLFLNTAETKQLEKLWSEHRIISRQAVAENEYLPQFIGFVTQDQPKAMELFFLSLKPAFQKRADELLADEQNAIPHQMDAVIAFASRAYRRPLQANEQVDLATLYKSIRGKGASHTEALRGMLVRILVSPAFLFRAETAPAGKQSGPVNDWELATRLSYFLWASLPDEELRTLAAQGKLRDPQVLKSQTERMLKDAKLRGLAVEFGTQWLHVRDFAAFNEKNEKLFPMFNTDLRTALNEEAVQFFQDLFQNNRPVLNVINADYTFLNESLAKHYGIPNVTGPQWRQVTGLRQYGRGGILGFGSVLSKQSSASRTSPVLRGNWVVETLLGERLPRPPKDVPQLPDVEGTEGFSTRQLVERHVKQESCATCHVRIDPFGFTLEKYDPIGRLRAKDFGGLAIDTRATIKDGSTFDGMDGLRNYLMNSKKDVITRLFCKRLLGYALGRSVTLSDTALLDEMVTELHKNDGKVNAAILAIVRSPQFLKVRGSEQTD